MGLLFPGFFCMQTHAQTQEEMQKWMDYMTPSDIHKMIASWDGTWNEDVTMWMGPGAPPMQMKTTSENKMLLDGRYQEAKHEGNFNGMPFQGMSVLGFDNARKIFFYSWIDNFGTGMIYMEGTWDPAKKTINLKGKMTDPMSGKLIDLREVITIVDDDTQLMEQYTLQDGKEFKSMELTSKRKK